MMQRASDWVLGTDPKQRLRLRRSLGADGVFLVCLVMEFAGVLLGMVDRTHAFAMGGLILTGLLVFYAAIRSGWSLRWSDPALTMPQMVFAIVVISLGYYVNPQNRGMVTILAALVLVFGAFILSPRRCRQLGWFAVATLGGVMLFGAIRFPLLFPPRLEAFNFLLTALVLPVIAALAGQLSALRFQQQAQKKELREALEKVRMLATHDELTGLPNRRQVLELLAHEERRALRQQASLCSCLIDIDHFKNVNDTLGHQAGDEALQRFSSILASALRAGDVLARWGGEEFILLLPATPLDEAASVIERLRARCADPASWVERPELQVTFSAGLSAHTDGESMQQVIARADAALYRAKSEGRNRLVIG